MFATERLYLQCERCGQSETHSVNSRRSDSQTALPLAAFQKVELSLYLRERSRLSHGIRSDGAASRGSSDELSGRVLVGAV